MTAESKVEQLTGELAAQTRIRETAERAAADASAALATEHTARVTEEMANRSSQEELARMAKTAAAAAIAATPVPQPTAQAEPKQAEPAPQAEAAPQAEPAPHAKPAPVEPQSPSWDFDRPGGQSVDRRRSRLGRGDIRPCGKARSFSRKAISQQRGSGSRRRQSWACPRRPWRLATPSTGYRPRKGWPKPGGRSDPRASMVSTGARACTTPARASPIMILKTATPSPLGTVISLTARLLLAVALAALGGCACEKEDWKTQVVSANGAPNCGFAGLKRRSKVSAALVERADPNLLEIARLEAERDCYKAAEARARQRVEL